VIIGTKYVLACVNCVVPDAIKVWMFGLFQGIVSCSANWILSFVPSFVVGIIPCYVNVLLVSWRFI
jgi:hypothetical protein